MNIIIYPHSADYSDPITRDGLMANIKLLKIYIPCVYIFDIAKIKFTLISNNMLFKNKFYTCLRKYSSVLK